MVEIPGRIITQIEANNPNLSELTSITPSPLTKSISHLRFQPKTRLSHVAKKDIKPYVNCLVGWISINNHDSFLYIAHYQVHMSIVRLHPGDSISQARVLRKYSREGYQSTLYPLLVSQRRVHWETTWSGQKAPGCWSMLQTPLDLSKKIMAPAFSHILDHRVTWLCY